MKIDLRGCFQIFLVLFLYGCVEAQESVRQEIKDTIESPTISYYQLRDSSWKHHLVAANNGASDKSTNFNTKLWTPAGGCKSCFMNIQHRMYNSVLCPDSASHCAIAKELTTMVNAFYNKADISEQILVAPIHGDSSLTYQQYKKVVDKTKISTGITEFILDTVKGDSNNYGYYVFGIGIASRYHLTHLFLDYTNPSTPKWWLFDDFGIGGNMFPNYNFNQLQKVAMTQKEVEAYYRKYLNVAIKGYSRSKTLKNATTAYGQNWAPYERPLYAEIYLINPKK